MNGAEKIMVVKPFDCEVSFLLLKESVCSVCYLLFCEQKWQKSDCDRIVVRDFDGILQLRFWFETGFRGSPVSFCSTLSIKIEIDCDSELPYSLTYSYI
jgi:hypothetical protein